MYFVRKRALASDLENNNLFRNLQKVIFEQKIVLFYLDERSHKAKCTGDNRRSTGTVNTFGGKGTLKISPRKSHKEATNGIALD